MSLPADFFHRLCRAGAQAPSGDNLQPWSFIIDGETLLVRHDPHRDLSLFNVRHLASFIALGSAIENILIGATEMRRHANIDYFPDSRDVQLIARISFDSEAERDPLVDFIERRCTNRRLYATTPLDPQASKNMQSVFENFTNVELSWVHEKTSLGELGRLIARADRLLFENKHIHDHFFSTLRWNQAEVESTRDGLPIDTLELGQAGSLAFRCLKRWSVVKFLNRFGFSRTAANHSVALMRRCSAAGLLTVPESSPSAFLQAGRVFQRVWLQATKENLALQPMTAVIFLQLRSRLSEKEGLTPNQIRVIDGLRRDLESFFAIPQDRVPAMLFRVGWGAPPSGRTIRRLH